jgi:membrane protein YqaA with SNARE-associated domain
MFSGTINIASICHIMKTNMAVISSTVKKFLAISILAATVVISVVGAVYLVKHWEYISMLEEQGYLGLFLISLFAGSPIPIPTPSMILTFTLGSILNPALVALVSGFGNSLGQALVYLTGRGGRVFYKSLGISWKTDENSWLGRFLHKLRMPRMREFARRHVLWAVFILGMYPNPLLMPIIMGMGAARYNFWKFYIVCFVGKTVESTALSYLGYFGLRSILRYVGIEIP